jgi:hypothetical protein
MLLDTIILAALAPLGWAKQRRAGQDIQAGILPASIELRNLAIAARLMPKTGNEAKMRL